MEAPHPWGFIAKFWKRGWSSPQISKKKGGVGLTVNILGTEYSVEIKAYTEDEAFERSSLSGYCDGWTKKIVVCDMVTYKGFDKEPEETCRALQRASLRHEVVHAFLDEAGLMDNALSPDCAWAKNEEMVDWFALQGPKIYEAWKTVGAL